MTTGEEDLSDYCQTCEVGIAEKAFYKACEKHMKKYDPEGEYTLDNIISDEANTRKLMSNFGESGYNPNWTLTTVKMVNICRFEDYRADRIEDHKAKIKAS